jgi:hypothetical protein
MGLSLRSLWRRGRLLPTRFWLICIYNERHALRIARTLHTDRLPHQKEQHTSHGSRFAAVAAETSTLALAAAAAYAQRARALTLEASPPNHECPLSWWQGHVSSTYMHLVCTCAGGCLAVTRSAVLHTCTLARSGRLALSHVRDFSAVAESCSGVARRNPIPAARRWGRRVGASSNAVARALRASTEIPAWRHRRAGSGCGLARPVVAAVAALTVLAAVAAHTAPGMDPPAPLAAVSHVKGRHEVPLDHSHRRQYFALDPAPSAGWAQAGASLRYLPTARAHTHVMSSTMPEKN